MVIVIGFVYFSLIAFSVFLSGKRIMLPQAMFWVGFIPGCMSIYYLSISDVYITEQDGFSYYNNSWLVLLFAFSLHCLGLYVSGLLFKSRVTVRKSLMAPLANLQKNIFIIFTPLLVIILLFINLMYAPFIPIFQSGYIDRFTFLQTTPMWPFLKAFGVIALPVPILLGYGLIYYQRRRALSCVLSLFALYCIYLFLIGQKFGGFLIGGFVFLTPYLIRGVEYNGVKYLLKYIFLFVLLVSSFLSVVMYHYSRYNLAEEFGGPLGLILYRVFVLQGHLYWGMVNHLDLAFYTSHPDFVGIYNAMHNMMLVVAPSEIALPAIERGVNFAFGYFVSYFYFLGFWGVLAYFVTGMLFGITCRVYVKAILENDFLLYFISSALLVWWVIYLQNGSVSLLLDFKFLAFVIFLVIIYFFRKMISLLATAKRQV
tara:strand:- start:529 stop:1809 length:1281 start_codon:yes stop_codon:yes gene_type:complete